MLQSQAPLCVWFLFFNLFHRLIISFINLSLESEKAASSLYVYWGLGCVYSDLLPWNAGVSQQIIIILKGLSVALNIHGKLFELDIIVLLDLKISDT